MLVNENFISRVDELKQIQKKLISLKENPLVKQIGPDALDRMNEVFDHLDKMINLKAGEEFSENHLKNVFQASLDLNNAIEEHKTMVVEDVDSDLGHSLVGNILKLSSDLYDDISKQTVRVNNDGQVPSLKIRHSKYLLDAEYKQNGESKFNEAVQCIQDAKTIGQEVSDKYHVNKLAYDPKITISGIDPEAIGDELKRIIYTVKNLAIGFSAENNFKIEELLLTNNPDGSGNGTYKGDGQYAIQARGKQDKSVAHMRAKLNPELEPVDLIREIAIVNQGKIEDSFTQYGSETEPVKMEPSPMILILVGAIKQLYRSQPEATPQIIEILLEEERKMDKGTSESISVDLG